MKQIQEIHIENFQSHEKTTIVPAPNGQLTVLTGQSDSGKTAILRALKWAFYNSPANTEFIRVGSNFARVTVGFSDGTTVTRWRSQGGINRYIVDGEVLEGFGTGVPLEVLEATGVKELTIGDMSFNLNLAEQLDGPFLGKSVSAPARAKVLGKLAGTEEIDYAGKVLGTDLYRRSQEEKRMANELRDIKNSLKEYDYLPAMQEKIIRLEEIVAKAKSLTNKKDSLIQLKNKLQLFDEAIGNVQQVINQYQNIELIEIMIGNIENNKNRQDQLLKNKVKLSTLNEGINQAQSVLNLTKNIPVAENLLVGITDKFSKKQFLESLNNKLKNLDFSINDTRQILKSLADLGQLNELVNKIPELVVRRGMLQEKYLRVSNFDDCILSCLAIIDDYYDVEEAEEEITLINEHAQKINILTQLQAKLSASETAINQERQKLVLLGQQLAELEGAFKDEMLSLGKCPLCGNENINPEKLKEVV